MKKKTTAKWLSAYLKAEKTEFARVKAYIAFRNATDWINIRVAYPRDGMGRLRVWVWGEDGFCHYGVAAGCGYDKLSTALEGVEFGYGIPALTKIAGAGEKAWHKPLEDAGFTVIQAI